MDEQQFCSCMDACQRCAQQCDECVAACLQETDTAALATCIALATDCAEFCRLAVAMMQRQSHFSAEVCRVCAEICDFCAVECDRHDHELCRRCANECAACCEECRQLTLAVIRA
ncbi:MAG: four-helix bundle copper-binding protein [Pirellulales bacterium]